MRLKAVNRPGLVRGHDVTQEEHHGYQPLRPKTRQRAVRLYFKELADGASSKAAALRAIEAVNGITTSTIPNWARAEEKKGDVAVEQSDAEKDTELAAGRKNARLKEANETCETGLSYFSPRRSSTAH